MLKKIARFVKVIILCFFTFVIVYLGVFYILSLWPYQQDAAREKPGGQEITIYLSTNGVHTDFVLPVTTTVIDWQSTFDFESRTIRWVAFGWGDRGFYIDTPTWSDLRMSTALQALSGVGASAMHVTAYSAFAAGDQAIKLTLTPAEYQTLVHYIQASFVEEHGEYQRIDVPGYEASDAFYEAKGSYSLFYTCNTWVNQGLKQCNQKAALWALHDQGILRHYK
ncbi:TIGR02117 family protein [Myroides sp. DF42-4-2]|uniref:TIGR02117 family protein n=1 Tax=unclassified Myroides TaxID=2642485 RepID=UPI002577E99E|nr:TIGR02117 family protein [Myroides sp. DF42-4-2]MDM1407493.1 TIGR02117 family protein [Myroides sp. DF42-4-2]